MNLRTLKRINYAMMNSDGSDYECQDMCMENDIQPKSGIQVNNSNMDNKEDQDEVLLLSLELEALELQEKKLVLRREVERKKQNIIKLQHDANQSPIMASQGIATNSTTTPPQSSILASLGMTVGPRIDTNPQVYLSSASAGNSIKYRKIVDFLPKYNHMSEDEIELGPGVFIKVGQGGKRKLENVSPAQWTVANSKILAEIIASVDDVEVGLLRNILNDYLSYTVKIGELATRFTWASVMYYDDDYRRRQAELSFRWGADSLHLSTIALKEREARSNGNGNSNANGKQYKAKRDNATPSRHCGYYNYGKDCPYDNCKFLHSCETCGKNHKKVDHDKVEGQGKPQE